MVKLAFDFPDEAKREIDALKAAMNDAGRGTVLKHGLGMLKWLVNELESSSDIFVQRKDGAIVTVEFVDLEPLINRPGHKKLYLFSNRLIFAIKKLLTKFNFWA